MLIALLKRLFALFRNYFFFSGMVVAVCCVNDADLRQSHQSLQYILRWYIVPQILLPPLR